MAGYCSPTLPQSRRDSDVHAHEYQDWRVQRGLQLLCPVLALQHRAQGLEDGGCSIGARSRSRRKGER